MPHKPWNLVADIGGTNARFGLADGSGVLTFSAHYSVADHGNFADALGEFLRAVAGLDGWQPLPNTSCFAVACPPEAAVLHFTNSPWSIDRAAVTAQLGGGVLDIINDFTAVGHGVTDLQPGDWRQLGGDQPDLQRPIAVLGPGTGLGVCTVVPVGNGYTVLGGEGGHVDFAPNDSRERALLAALAEQFGHVSVERLLSGSGLVNIHQALAQIDGRAAPALTPADITTAALNDSDASAVETLTIFCRVLGAVAGDLALALGAKGGIYIAGGIIPRVLPFVERSGLRERFEAKGRFQGYLAPIPIRIITKPDLGLHGAVKRLQQIATS